MSTYTDVSVLQLVASVVYVHMLSSFEFHRNDMVVSASSWLHKCIVDGFSCTENKTLETIFKTNVCHSTAQAAHYYYCCMCVALVSLGFVWREVSCRTINAAKALAADSKGGSTKAPFLFLLHVVQSYLDRKSSLNACIVSHPVLWVH